MDVFERLQAALGPAYQLERELGGGGMSRVFVATESALGRRVVIKVLPPELAAGLSTERFKREIQLAASLQHPHIVPLLAAGPADDMLYYTMPLIEGESLRTKIAREGELPIGEAVRILRDVVDALTCAHEQGIVHRDIKPDNVLVSRHHGLVADFGVAKALSEATGPSSFTSTGIALGTPAYMAPEQATADPHVDHRADIYAVGALAYEMLCGRPPFLGTSSQAVLAAQVTQAPDPVTRYRASVPPGLSALIMRCLEKHPADRFQSAEELLHLLETMATPSSGTAPTEARPAFAFSKRLAARARALKRHRAFYVALGALIVLGLAWSMSRNRSGHASGPLLPAAKTVVVLPFENVGRPQNEYFADGITEEITNRLTGIGGLRVISRNSAKQYKATQKPLKQVGQELSATYALVGTVRWEKPGDSTSRIRVSPELINVTDGTNLWAHGYDAVAADIFQMQSDIAERVAEALNVALADPERQALAGTPTRSPEAYDYYLRGKQYWERGYGERPLRLAEDLYHKALTADPQFALAWAALSRTHDLLYWFYYDKSDSRLAQQKEAAERALNLEPNLPEGHVALGLYHYHGRLDYDAALAEFELARKVRPNDSEVFDAIALVQRRQGRWKEAFENQERARKLDPRSLGGLMETGTTAVHVNELAEAESYFAKAVALAPDEAPGYIGLSDVALFRGDRHKARDILRQGLDRVGTDRLVPALFRSGHLSAVFVLLEEGHAAELHRPSISAFGSDSFMFYIANATLYQQEGRAQLARAYADSTRVLLQQRLRNRPDDPFYHGFLSWAYAIRGQKPEAVREGRVAVDVLPLSKDALSGQTMLWMLARTFALVGEPDSAVKQIKLVLSLPSGTSIAALKVDPAWDMLRGSPAFKSLLAEHRPVN